MYVQLWCVLLIKPIFVKHTNTAHKSVSLRINLRVSKHLGENRIKKKLNINLENREFPCFVLHIFIYIETDYYKFDVVLTVHLR